MLSSFKSLTKVRKIVDMEDINKYYKVIGIFIRKRWIIQPRLSSKIQLSLYNKIHIFYSLFNFFKLSLYK